MTIRRIRLDSEMLGNDEQECPMLLRALNIDAYDRGNRKERNDMSIATAQVNSLTDLAKPM